MRMFMVQDGDSGVRRFCFRAQIIRMRLSPAGVAPTCDLFYPQEILEEVISVAILMKTHGEIPEMFIYKDPNSNELNVAVYFRITNSDAVSTLEKSLSENLRAEVSSALKQKKRIEFLIEGEAKFEPAFTNRFLKDIRNHGSVLIRISRKEQECEIPLWESRIPASQLSAPDQMH